MGVVNILTSASLYHFNTHLQAKRRDISGEYVELEKDGLNTCCVVPREVKAQGH